MKLFVAVTDNEWYWQLRSRPLQDEVNFWQPGGGRRFQALKAGELLLFKPHTPHHSIVGGGFFLHASELPCSLAWEIFGVANGALGLWEMRRRIERFRRLGPEARGDYAVGCVLLQRPFFFDESDWIPVPADFSKNVGQGKLYDTSRPDGHALWEAVRLRLQALQPSGPADTQGEMFAEPALFHPALGPCAFRLLITDLYHRRCALSNDDVLPTLEATHIRPLRDGGIHRVDNGLLLRSDLRRLFDRGYLAVDPSYRVLISDALEREFEGGRDYRGLAGAELARPTRSEYRPRREFLDWHRAKVFLG